MIDKGDVDFSYLAGDLASNTKLIGILLFLAGVTLIVLITAFGKIWKPTRRR